jgi:hypothetical protein
MRVACGTCLRGLTGKPEGKRALGKRRRRQEDNVKVAQKLESGKAVIRAHICST